MTVDLHCWTLNPYSVLVLGLDAGELGAAVVVGVPLCPLTTYHQKIFALQNFSYFWTLTHGEFGSTISVFYFCHSEVGQRETEEETGQSWTGDTEKRHLELGRVFLLRLVEKRSDPLLSSSSRHEEKEEPR